MRGLKDKVFIVGGGAGGIGAALAKRLVEEGARVMIGDVKGDEAEATAKALGDNAKAMWFDLADEASIQALVAATVDSFGRLDGLANTGADLTKATMGQDYEVRRMSAPIWARTFEVNVTGHALLIQAAIPHLEAAGGGSVVITSSNAAFTGMPELPAYAASKSGLFALTRHVASIGGKQKIRCNAIVPGLVITPGSSVNMTEEMRQRALAGIALTRLGEVDDIASAMAFLLSDDATWVTGQCWSVNGGVNYRD